MKRQFSLALQLGLLVLAWGSSVVGATVCVSEPNYLNQIQGIAEFRDYQGKSAIAVGVTVVVTRGDFRRETVTDEDGYFGFPNLAPGNYIVRAKTPGHLQSGGDVRVRDQGHRDRVVRFVLEYDLDSCHLLDTLHWRDAQALQESLPRITNPQPSDTVPIDGEGSDS